MDNKQRKAIQTGACMCRKLKNRHNDSLVEMPEKHSRFLGLVMSLFSTGESVTHECLQYANIHLLFTYEPCSSYMQVNEKLRSKAGTGVWLSGRAHV